MHQDERLNLPPGLLTDQQELVRRSVGTPGVTLVVGAFGSGKTTLASLVGSDRRRGRTVGLPTRRYSGLDTRLLVSADEVEPYSLDEVERRACAELGQARPGDVAILDGLDELAPVPDLDRLMRFVQAPWLDQAHILILTRAPLAGAQTAFQDAQRASSGARSYRLIEWTWSYRDLTGELERSEEVDHQDAEALLALLQSTAHNPRLVQALLAAVQNQISGDRSRTPDLLFVPDRNGQLRVVPSTGLGTADVELMPGRTVAATPRITYRATRGFWLPEAMRLEELINDPSVREHDLQSFFEEYPHLLAGTSYDQVIPHPVLIRDQDGPLIPDFMLEPADGGFADVLDLKLPRAKVVAGRKDRVRTTANVTEALAQVREYRSYFDDAGHRQAIQDRYGLQAYRPTVAVIIGRDPGPGRDRLELKRLWDDLPGHVKLMTYDELLRQVRRLGSF